MVGFKNTTLDIISIPSLKSPAPFIIDDCTLAFFLGYRTKTLWYLLTTKNQQYRISKIPKKTPGKFRTLHDPTPLMKSFLKRINTRILNPLQEQLGNHVTAYRPGHSIKDAALRHLPPCPVCDNAPPAKMPSPHTHDCPRRGTFIQMDLKNFFPNTRRAWIRHYFQSLGYSFYVSGLLANLMTVPIHNSRTRKISHEGIPQGAPTSGAICNLVANQKLDRRILQYLSEKNKYISKETFKWVYGRYADDLTLSCGIEYPKSERKTIIQDITNLVNQSGYWVNPRKTRITGPQHRTRMLGIVIDKKPSIAKTDYKKLRAMVHNCAITDIPQQAHRANYTSTEKFIQHLRGKLNIFNQIDARRGAPLLEEFQFALERYKSST